MGVRIERLTGPPPRDVLRSQATKIQYGYQDFNHHQLQLWDRWKATVLQYLELIEIGTEVLKKLRNFIVTSRYAVRDLKDISNITTNQRLDETIRE